MEIKEALLQQCKKIVNGRLLKLQHSIRNIQESLSSETKSSAGDKHETGRAMLQLEREKLGAQLAEVQKLNETLLRISIENTSETIRLGSVVYTSSSNYFISISIGEINYDQDKFFAISPSTPMGKLLIGKREGESIVFRGTEIVVDKCV